MAVTINASTTAGLVNTADTSGILQLQTANTTAVTVDASQNVTFAGVTTLQAGTAALPALTTTGDTNTGIFFPAADTLAFSEGGAEAMRIDSSGNVGVGATSSGSRFHSESSANQTVGYFKNTNASNSNDGVQIAISRNTTDGSYRALTYYNAGASAYRFWVLDSGNVQNTNNSYGAFSDVKLKENIVDASPKLANLMQVKVRNYNLIGDTNKQLGVVAQELETVFPAMIDVSPDKDSEGNDLGTTTKSVKYSVFVPMLIKAIQEQQALITQLQADVATLKGTP